MLERERERERERESTVEDEQLLLFLGFYTVLVEFYTEEVLRGFLPCGFPKENICVLLCYYICLYFSDPFLMVMMLNVLDIV